MMAAVVVALIAALCMLLGGVAVMAMRLIGAVRQLRAVLEGLGQRLQPMVDELREGSEVAGIEVAALQANVARLGEGRREARH